MLEATWAPQKKFPADPWNVHSDTPEYKYESVSLKKQVGWGFVGVCSRGMLEFSKRSPTFKFSTHISRLSSKIQWSRVIQQGNVPLKLGKFGEKSPVEGGW